MVRPEHLATRLSGLLVSHIDWQPLHTYDFLLLHWRGNNFEVFEPFGGLLETQARLQRGSRQPMLMFGLSDMAWVRDTAPGFLPAHSQAWRVLDWPGLSYLRYDQLPEGLKAGYQSAVAGAAAPVPEGVIGDKAPLVRALSELRHLLIENRQKALFARKKDLLDASKSGEPVSDFHLAPTEAFDTRGQKKLQRLWELDGLFKIIVPASGGLGQLQDAVAVFAQNWQEFEAAKERITRAKDDNERGAALSDTIERISAVSRTLTEIESRIGELQSSLEEIETL